MRCTPDVQSAARAPLAAALTVPNRNASTSVTLWASDTQAALHAFLHAQQPIRPGDGNTRTASHTLSHQQTGGRLSYVNQNIVTGHVSDPSLESAALLSSQHAAASEASSASASAHTAGPPGLNSSRPLSRPGDADRLHVIHVTRHGAFHASALLWMLCH